MIHHSTKVTVHVIYQDGLMIILTTSFHRQNQVGMHNGVRRGEFSHGPNTDLERATTHMWLVAGPAVLLLQRTSCNNIRLYKAAWEISGTYPSSCNPVNDPDIPKLVVHLPPLPVTSFSTPSLPQRGNPTVVGKHT